MFNKKKNGDTVVKNFKFRLAPSKAEALQMAKIAGAARHARNEYVKAMEAYRLAAKEEKELSELVGGYIPGGQPVVPRPKFSDWWREFKNREDKKWLRQYNDHIVRGRALRCEQTEYKTAWQRYKQTGSVKKAGFPKPNRRRVECSFTIPDKVKVKDGKLAIPVARGVKSFRIRMRANRGRGHCELIEKLSEGREITWTPKTAVVKREALALAAPFNPPDNPSQKNTKRRGNRSCSFLRTDKWFVYIQCEVAADLVAPPPHTGKATGIDIGVARSFQLSDREDNYYQMPQSERLEARRKRYDRRMKRQMNMALIAIGWDGKGGTRKAAMSQLGKKRKAEAEEKSVSRVPFISRRYEINKRRMAKASRKIAHARDNGGHQISSAITMKYAHIVMEDLTIPNMLKSAAGTVEKPGKQVAQKRGLNRAIAAQGWGMVRSKIEYKAAWRGGRFETVAAQNTSCQCAQCGHTAKENRKTQARFVCTECGHRDHADFNAAKNILARAEILADGDTAVGHENVGLTVRGGGGIRRSEIHSGTRPVKRKKSILQGRVESVLSENQPDVHDVVKPPL